MKRFPSTQRLFIRGPAYSTGRRIMTAPGPVRRFLLYGIIFGALPFAAAASGTSAVLWPAPAGAVAPMLHGNQQGGAEASLEYVHWNRFCRWYRHHGFCRKLIEMPRFCD